MYASDFDTIFDAAKITIEFKSEYANGTGYFDPMVDLDLGLKTGEAAKMIDRNGRKVIIVNTIFGNAVFFERYIRNGESDNVIVVSNTPTNLRGLMPNGELPGSVVIAFAGWPGCDNIGKTLDKIITDSQRRRELKQKQAANKAV